MLQTHKTSPSFLFLVLVTGAVLLFVACKKNAPPDGAAASRSFRMGFMSSAPRPDINLYLQSLSLWPLHSDATIISTEVPWDSLLNGENPVTYVTDEYMELVSYCRGRHLQLWVYIDPANGLNRASDADQLVARGKSIAQPAMQQVYRRFVFVVDSLLRPDHLGLALETNLIRTISPDSIYQGVKKSANDAAADIRAFDPQVPLSVSVQAEVAWGMLNGSAYVGVAGDFTDFPFLQELGISSYPYMSFSHPGDMPLNYYSRLITDHPLPVFITEGGWTSRMIPTGVNGQVIQSSPAIQAAFIQRQGQLLSEAHATGLFQLTFTDLDLAGWPPSDAAGLSAFAFLGVVDSNFTPKPALVVWDSLLKQPLLPGN